MKTKAGAHTFFGRVRAAYAVLTQYKYTTLAGTLVFFLITSIVPFLFWLTLLFGESPAGDALWELELFGWARDLIAVVRENASEASRGAGILFLATTLWSSTGFFYHLRRIGEIIYGCNRPKHGWKVRLSALLFTFGLLAFFAAAGAVVFAGAMAVRLLDPWLGYPALYVLLFLMGFFAAWILNVYVCPYRVGPSDTALGSLITGGLWLAASAAFSVYLTFSSAERLYGALSLVIVFLLFLYWMMTCFTVGVVFNRHRLELRGRAHKRL